MKKTDYIVTGKLMTWENAIDYALSQGMFIPNYKLAKSLNLDIEFWSSSTIPFHVSKAKTNKVRKDGAPLKSELIQVVLTPSPNIDGIETQDVTYRVGDAGYYY